MEMSATEFKAKCLGLLDYVHETGEEIVILKHGKRVGRLVGEGAERPWKRLEGTGTFAGDPFEPAIGESEIEALR